MIFFNHELLQLGIIQQNVMMENHLVTGNSQCVVVCLVIRTFGFLKKAAAKVNKDIVWMQMLLITS